jgi:hypothetical protein
MAQTPYQQKLWLVWQEAHTDRCRDVEVLLRDMIAALENDRYGDLPGLRGSLPPKYAAMVGPPPRSRATSSCYPRVAIAPGHGDEREVLKYLRSRVS